VRCTGLAARAVATAAIVALLPLAASACGTARPGLSNGSVSVCYRAIPTALGTFQSSRATLVGVHRMDADVLRRRLPSGSGDQLPMEDDTSVCVLTFKGSFLAGGSGTALSERTRAYAVVVISSHQLALVASLLTDDLPRGLGGRAL
jgi:hypothetical protein